MIKSSRGWTRPRLAAYMSSRGRHRDSEPLKSSDIELLPEGYFIVNDGEVWDLFYLAPGGHGVYLPIVLDWSTTREGAIRLANPEYRERVVVENSSDASLYMELSNMGAESKNILDMMEEANPKSDFVSRQKFLLT